MMGKKKRAPEPIGGTIKATMKTRGLTAYALGKASGVNATIIGRWLNGERSPSLGTVKKLVTALDLVLVPRDQVE
jgi:transcriptional regulator with XRE-family HTH domain